MMGFSASEGVSTVLSAADEAALLLAELPFSQPQPAVPIVNMHIAAAINAAILVFAFIE